MNMERERPWEKEIKDLNRRYKNLIAVVSGVAMGAQASFVDFPLALPAGLIGISGIYFLDRSERLVIVNIEMGLHLHLHKHNPVMDELIFQEIQENRKRGENLDASLLWRIVGGYKRSFPQYKVLGDEPFWYALGTNRIVSAKSLISPTLEVINGLTGQRPERSELERETTLSLERVRDLLPLI